MERFHHSGQHRIEFRHPHEGHDTWRNPKGQIEPEYVSPPDDSHPSGIPLAAQLPGAGSVSSCFRRCIACMA